jgi:hypothetical protein
MGMAFEPDAPYARPRPRVMFRLLVLGEPRMSAAHEVAEHWCGVRVDAVVVAVDEVVGDEADEALREGARGAAGGCDEVGLGEALTARPPSPGAWRCARAP